VALDRQQRHRVQAEVAAVELTTDTARNRRSLSELATVGDVEWIGTGHGPELIASA
jgi:hypothetical protein